jgi:hypothetical protein
LHGLRAEKSLMTTGKPCIFKGSACFELVASLWALSEIANREANISGFSSAG